MAPITLPALLLAAFGSSMVNADSIAGWQGVRATQINDTWILQGGLMSSGPFANGKFDASVVGHPNGYYYQLPLNQSFSTSTSNSLQIIGANIGMGQSTSRSNYIGGGIFSNDHQWYTFG